MAIAWLIWRATRNSGWVDTVWTFSVGAVGLGGALLPATGSDALDGRRAMVAALALLWALRLGAHIAQRTSGRGRPPLCQDCTRLGHGRATTDVRFVAEAGAGQHTTGIAMVLAASNPAGHMRVQDWLAAVVMIIAILGEAIADRQLRRFAADPANRGKVCDVGLWRLSRHPNYFFEWLGWLAYPLLAIGSWEWGWIALSAPVCMYWLLAHVSGVPPLEEHMLATRGDAYRAYQARTSAFFPMLRSSR